MRTKLLLTVLLLTFFILVFLFLKKAGIWLVQSDQLQKADIIFVFMGSTVDRTLYANDLCHEGFAHQIWMVSDYEPGRELMMARGFNFPNEADKTCELLIQLGLIDSLIIVIPGDAQSTNEESILLSQFLKSHPQTDTLLLVTSASHSRRAAIILKDVLSEQPQNILLISCPSPYSDFNPEHWWQDRNSAKKVFNEYTKLLYFYLWDKF